MMTESIRNKLGIRYRYGTQGPRSYDCSGFIWKVFNESGIAMTRTSAREFWRQYEPVTGEDRFKFGTLVFFNKLGHVGIVASKDGFYHASSSRGVTYSKFKGYWSKRIVGYRRIPLNEPNWEDFAIVDEDTVQ
jgi:cell wall-associated NlpC family hydrolase